MPTYDLHKWSVINHSSIRVPPEMKLRVLLGYRDLEPRLIRTSPFVLIMGRQVTTMTGSIYNLKDIDPAYLNWLIESDIEYDPIEPLKIRDI